MEKPLENLKTYEESKIEQFSGIFTPETVRKLIEISNQATENYLKNLKVKKTNPGIKGFLVTINPKKGTNISQLMQVVNKVIRKKWIESAIYSYEQRGETLEDVRGLHTHILVVNRTKKYKSQVIKEVASTAKLLCNSNGINVKYVKTDADYNRIVDYIKGQKKDPSGVKNKKVRVDRHFRQKNNLLDFYCYPTKKFGE